MVQSVAAARFLWRSVARAHAERVENGGGVLSVKGAHDEYQRLPDPVIHRRELRLAKQARTLFVTDFLECQNSHAIELFFHFSEECELECLAGDYFGARNGGKDIAIGVDSGPRVCCTAGPTGLLAGWVSRMCGRQSATLDYRFVIDSQWIGTVCQRDKIALVKLL